MPPSTASTKRIVDIANNVDTQYVDEMFIKLICILLQYHTENSYDDSILKEKNPL